MNTKIVIVICAGLFAGALLSCLLYFFVPPPSPRSISNTDTNGPNAYAGGVTICDAADSGVGRGEPALEYRDRQQLCTLHNRSDAPIRHISDTEAVVSKSAVLKELGGNIGRVLRMASITPCIDFRRRGFSGFKIDNIQDGSIVEQAGLRNGDLVQVVNGQALSSPQKVIQIYRKAKNQPLVAVNIMRKNEPLTLRYSLQK